MQSFLTTALQIFKNSSFQFLYFFGSLFIAGIILTWISRWTQNVFRQFKFPNFGLYVFGVIGVPVHELCHYVFAKVFFHDVKKVKWFDPKGRGGSSGSVTHCYNDHNFYHRLGLFFIGMGPVILAPILLSAIYYSLVPGSANFDFSILNLAKSLEAFGLTLTHIRNWSSIGFYFFIYLTVCITSQMELSPDDFKITRGGIFPFFVLFFLANVLAAVFKFNLHGKFQYFLNSSFVLWIGFFALAIVIALLNLILCLVLMNLINKLTGAELINPFRS